MNATANDTLVVVWGSEDDTTTAAKEIIIRAKEATIGIPSETRQALPGGTNGFERILPGPDRMYPDTDLPPKRVTAERLDAIRAMIPAPFWEREQWYATLGVPADVVRPLAISPYAKLFATAVKEWRMDPVLCSVAMVQFSKRLRRQLGRKFELPAHAMESVLRAHHEGRLPKDAILCSNERTP
ncbi:MAG: hypothetical protein IPP94_18355 [Ignavibacteria bacterium]|nr:hypothetical protein [Ignavibacteria bacterium]